MSDLFKFADYSAVMHGDRHGKMQWSCGAGTLKIRSVSDDRGNQYAIVPGTEFVIAISGATDISRQCTVWRGGLMGHIIANTNSLDSALAEVKKAIPSHIVYRLQQEAGHYSGRRKAI